MLPFQCPYSTPMPVLLVPKPSWGIFWQVMYAIRVFGYGDSSGKLGNGFYLVGLCMLSVDLVSEWTETTALN
jgi:hypothetical protein